MAAAAAETKQAVAPSGKRRRPLPLGYGLPDPGTAHSGTMASWGSYLPEAESRGCGYTFCSAARFAASASPSPAPLPPSCVPGRDFALRMRWYRL